MFFITIIGNSKVPTVREVVAKIRKKIPKKYSKMVLKRSLIYEIKIETEHNRILIDVAIPIIKFTLNNKEMLNYL